MEDKILEMRRQRERAIYKALPFWKRAERVIAQQLRLKGIPCQLIAGRNLGWDIVTKSGLHIECKAARLLRNRCKNHLIRASFWVVGIARPSGRTHQLREKCVDFYVVRLLGDDLRKLYLVLPAPLRAKQLQVTFRQLLTKYRNNVNAWHLITDAGRTRHQKREAKDGEAIPAKRG